MAFGSRPAPFPGSLPPSGPHRAGPLLLPTRREFVTGLAAAGLLGGLGRRSFAAPDPAPAPPELTGTEFDLTIGETAVNLTGAPRRAVTVNGSLPAPTLRWREGDTVKLRVRNTLDEMTSIHWHGILLPADQDGVPGLSFDGIFPGETHTYRFTVRQAGTYWYHSHSAFQEQRGLYGAIIVEPREPDPIAYDREQVVILSDWTDEHPERVFSKLKKLPHYYNRNQPTVFDFFRDWRREGWGSAVSERLAWGAMRMNRSDIADVTGETYTFLTNGQPPAANWTGLFRPGERVRLRFVNAAAMTHFDCRIPGLPLTVVAADGLPVHPVTVEEFRIAPAETFDVIVRPRGQEAFSLFAQAMDRSGYASGTLAVRPGLSAPIPALDSPPLLTMADVGHGAHSGHGAGAASSDSTPAAGPEAAHHGMAHGGGHGMAHGGHGMAHGGHGMPDAPPPQRHPASEHGNPLVDMQAMAPTPRLRDPGIGLRDTGRRALTYGDLRSLDPDPDGRQPGREIEMHLTGNMERYSWSFDGIPFSGAEPVRLSYGERLRIVLVNDTMMTHPVHLHGMWSDLEDEGGAFLARKHTVDMPPGTRRSFRVRADALGRWAFHCHLLFHMAAGMFREVRVEES